MQSVERIGERFWYITPVSETDRPILGMVVGDQKALMIDAGNSEAHAEYFLAELTKRQVPRPDIVCLTHWHWDHIFGLSALTEAVSISSKETKQEIEKLIGLSWTDTALDERVQEGTEIEFCSTAIKKEFSTHRDIAVTLPTLSFENRIEIDLGGVTCILQHVGGDHASDSVVIYIKEEKILFLGDCIYADIYAEKRNYTIEKTLQMLELLETFDAEYYVLSHWKPISKAEFQQEAYMLREIAKLTESCKGEKPHIIKKYRDQVKRDLNEDELEIIEEFLNGYK
ncbi:MBL fold metallo-hydrolase [Bacillus sp. JJ1764]|uniref:MBL fold metallo-hydrolase n=1 Tax=Bacillus sp. JJ1764 TaxID=3122964 RepID=UPI002FFD9DF3